jgi:hypothetical protein
MMWLSVTLMGAAALVLLLVCYGVSGEPLNPSENETENESCTK